MSATRVQGPEDSIRLADSIRASDSPRSETKIPDFEESAAAEKVRKEIRSKSLTTYRATFRDLRDLTGHSAL